MPELRERSLGQGTVMDALDKARRATLPDDLLESDLVSWVLGYDDGVPADETEHALEEWFTRPDPATASQRLAVLLLYRALIEQRLPMYARALFTFGRPMRAVQLSLIDCERALGQGALKEAARRFTEEVPELGQPAEVVLATLAEDAMRNYSARLHGYERVRQVWEQEVGTLRDSLVAVSELPGQEHTEERLAIVLWNLVKILAIMSAVPRALNDAGLPDATPPGAMAEAADAVQLAGVLGLAAMMERYPPDLLGLFHEIAQAPWVQAEQRTLDLRYGSIDPFAPYDPGKLPPDAQLLILLQENRLTGGRPSSWLSRWRARLVYSGWVFTPPTPAERNTEAALNWGALRADCQIKGSLDPLSGPPPSTIDAVLQQLFETKWVQSVALSLVGSSPAGVIIRGGWNADELAKYVESIVQLLNRQGYSLKAPGRSRLEALLQLARGTRQPPEPGSW